SSTPRPLANTRPTPSFPSTLGSEGQTIYTLDEIQVIHVDRRMLDTDQHLAGGRCWRFGKVGKLEDDARLAESSDLHGTHSAPPRGSDRRIRGGRDRPADPRPAARGHPP